MTIRCKADYLRSLPKAVYHRPSGFDPERTVKKQCAVKHLELPWSVHILFYINPEQGTNGDPTQPKDENNWKIEIST